MYLLRDAPLDVFDGEVSGCGMLGVDNVEEVRGSCGLEKGVGRGEEPGGEPIGVEICYWGRVVVGGMVVVRKVSMMVMVRRDGLVGSEIEVVFHRCEKSEEILFELKADEFFGTHVCEGVRTRWVLRIPGRCYGLS